MDIKEFDFENGLYTIHHVMLFTGLSERSIRGYIAAGFLRGEKINGLWHFTPEQVEGFTMHPSVRPSIVSKNKSIIYDFIIEDKKTEEMCCIVLDIPSGNRKKICEFFCYEINNGNYNIGFRFALDAPRGKNIRIILKGRTDEVLSLVNAYYKKESS